MLTSGLSFFVMITLAFSAVTVVRRMGGLGSSNDQPSSSASLTRDS